MANAVTQTESFDVRWDEDAGCWVVDGYAVCACCHSQLVKTPGAQCQSCDKWEASISL